MKSCHICQTRASLYGFQPQLSRRRMFRGWPILPGSGSVGLLTLICTFTNSLRVRRSPREIPILRERREAWATLKSSVQFNRRVTLLDKNTPDIPESLGISSFPGRPVGVLWTTLGKVRWVRLSSKPIWRNSLRSWLPPKRPSSPALRNSPNRITAAPRRTRCRPLFINCW